MKIPIPTLRISFAPLKKRDLLHYTLLRPIPLQACLVYFAFAIYSLLWVGIFFGLVRPWINGEIWSRIGADSDRYWATARLIFDSSHNYGESLVTFQANYLGPVLIAGLVKRQSLVVAFNYLLFFMAVRAASTIRGVTSYIFVALLMLNAETGVALITLNKEIFSLLSAVMVAKYLLSEERSLFYLSLAVAASVVTRWEQAALVLLVAFFTRKNSFFSRRHKLAIFYLVAGITVIYPLFAMFLGNYLGAFTQYIQGANTVLKLERLQEHFGFPLVLLPKIFLNLFGRLSNPTYFLNQFWDDGFVDLHSQIILPLFTMALVPTLLVARSRGKLALTRPIALQITVYLIGTAVTPFVQPRYEYFVYVLVCLELARDEPSLHPVTSLP